MNALTGFLQHAGRGIGLGVAWLAAYVLARLLIEGDAVEGTARVVVALIPLLPFAMLLWWVQRGLRDMDELHRKVNLEALAVSYPIAILMIMVMGLVDLAIGIPVAHFHKAWVFLMLLYFTALWVAWRKYL